MSMNPSWKAHAYPLKLLTIHVQGTRHTDIDSIAGQLEVVAKRLRDGELRGEDHDDDFGYRFKLEVESDTSIFDGGCGGY